MLNFPFMRHRSRAIQPICPLALPLNTDHRAIRTRCPLNNFIIYSTSSFNSFINIPTKFIYASSIFLSIHVGLKTFLQER